MKLTLGIAEGDPGALGGPKWWSPVLIYGTGELFIDAIQLSIGHGIVISGALVDFRLVLRFGAVGMGWRCNSKAGGKQDRQQAERMFHSVTRRREVGVDRQPRRYRKLGACSTPRLRSTPACRKLHLHLLFLLR